MPYQPDKLEDLRNNDIRYNGEVYLSIRHNSFSAAADFAWTFKQFRMGAVIGEETGGLAVCFGDILYFTLPHAEMNCSVSYKRFYSYGATEREPHGTLPDYNVFAGEALDWTIGNLIRD